MLTVVVADDVAVAADIVQKMRKPCVGARFIAVLLQAPVELADSEAARHDLGRRRAPTTPCALSLVHLCQGATDVGKLRPVAAENEPIVYDARKVAFVERLAGERACRALVACAGGAS